MPTSRAYISTSVAVARLIANSLRHCGRVAVSQAVKLSTNSATHHSGRRNGIRSYSKTQGSSRYCSRTCCSNKPYCGRVHAAPRIRKMSPDCAANRTLDGAVADVSALCRCCVGRAEPVSNVLACRIAATCSTAACSRGFEISGGIRWIERIIHRRARVIRPAATGVRAASARRVVSPLDNSSKSRSTLSNGISRIKASSHVWRTKAIRGPRGFSRARSGSTRRISNTSR